MCLALFALDAHPLFALVVAANRDEYHARPAAPAAWWDAGWLAGRDIKAGGTWFGVTREARWAFVTNVREPARHDPNAPSRGALVPAVLADPAPPSGSVARVVACARACNGFNLVAGTVREACWGSNRADATRALAPGIHGVSNAALDTPWPKVARTKAALRAWCARADRDLDPLFAMLGDTTGAPDHAAARDRDTARSRTAARGALHRQRNLRNALLDGAHHRPRRRRALRRADVRRARDRDRRRRVRGSPFRAGPRLSACNC